MGSRADIKGAFDNIDHEFLLNAIEGFPAREAHSSVAESGVHGAQGLSRQR